MCPNKYEHKAVFSFYGRLWEGRCLRQSLDIPVTFFNLERNMALFCSLRDQVFQLCYAFFLLCHRFANSKYLVFWIYSPGESSLKVRPSKTDIIPRHTNILFSFRLEI